MRESLDREMCSREEKLKLKTFLTDDSNYASQMFYDNPTVEMRY